MRLTRDTPPLFPPRIHSLVNLFIDIIGFFIILFVCCASEKTKFVIWILKLFGIYIVFTSSGASLTNVP